VRNDNWGSTARLGIFIVGSEAVPEAEWWAMAPPAVSVHAARVTAATPWAEWEADGGHAALAPDLERGAAQFAGMALSAVVLAHSSSSIIGGPGWDDAVIARLQGCVHETTRVTTNGLDCVRALRQCGVERPFLVFPPWFAEQTMQTGAGYFAAHGFRDPPSFRHVPEDRWAHVPPRDLYRNFMHLEQNADLLFDQIVGNCPDSADGVLIVGTGLRCVGLIEGLEAALGRPVVTANQASLWRCLGLAGVDVPVTGYGRLLAGPRDPG
jgi:maleate isomerase